MHVRTVAVDPRDVENRVTRAAHALWVAFLDVTSVNETSPALWADAHLMADNVANFGPWSQRRATGIAALTSFYRTWYGEAGGALIEEYFSAKDRADNVADDDPWALRFAEARKALVKLHGGFIVDDYAIRRPTEEMLDEDDLTPNAFPA